MAQRDPNIVCSGLSHRFTQGEVRWRRFSTEVGGSAKVGSGLDHAASLCSVVALSGASPG